MTGRTTGQEASQASGVSRVRHSVLVLSGKGGFGKSTGAVSLSVSPAIRGRTPGLLDAGVHGPSVPIMPGAVSDPVQGIEGP